MWVYCVAGAGVEIANYRVLCSQLEAQIHQMHDRGGSRGAAGATAGARGEHRERRDGGPSMAKVLACLDRVSILCKPRGNKSKRQQVKEADWMVPSHNHASGRMPVRNGMPAAACKFAHVEKFAKACAWVQDDEARQQQRQHRQQEQIEQDKADARDGQAMKREVSYPSHVELAALPFLPSNSNSQLSAVTFSPELGAARTSLPTMAASFAFRCLS